MVVALVKRVRHLRQLRKLGVIEPQARFFAKNRGLALLVREGNPVASENPIHDSRSAANQNMIAA
jgi:hypothetical protein